MAVDAMAMRWAFAPIRRRGKTARPRVQQLTAAAEMIRASVTNRVDNGESFRRDASSLARPAQASDAALHTNAKR